jgi:hypothetical protein
MRLNRGARLGPCEITAPIGAGGMGEVYKFPADPINVLLNCTAALKR